MQGLGAQGEVRRIGKVSEPSVGEFVELMKPRVMSLVVFTALTGMLADASGSLTLSLVLPALCYAVIVAFGLFAVRPVAPIEG